MIRNGKIVPAHLNVEIIKAAIGKQSSATFLLDGFPRTIGALTLLEEELSPCRSALVFEADDAFMERASGKSGDDLVVGAAPLLNHTARMRLSLIHLTLRAMCVLLTLAAACPAPNSHVQKPDPTGGRAARE